DMLRGRGLVGGDVRGRGGPRADRCRRSGRRRPYGGLHAEPVSLPGRQGARTEGRGPSGPGGGGASGGRGRRGRGRRRALASAGAGAPLCRRRPGRQLRSEGVAGVRPPCRPLDHDGSLVGHLRPPRPWRRRPGGAHPCRAPGDDGRVAARRRPLAHPERHHPHGRMEGRHRPRLGVRRLPGPGRSPGLLRPQSHRLDTPRPGSGRPAGGDRLRQRPRSVGAVRTFEARGAQERRTGNL
ncbi:MAG: DNA alkylation repair enzyme, partial [uncultured Acidimicrobiales bacterium]